MSKNSTMGRKRHSKTKSMPASLSTKSVPVTDIGKYLVKPLPVSSDVEYSANKASIPCPDAAALPCSTFLCTVHVEVADSCDHYKSSVCKNSSKISVGDLKVKNALPIESSNLQTAAIIKKKTKKPTLVPRNTQITDFFPARRSNRKTSVMKITETKKVIEDAILSGKEEGFEVKMFPDKGRGIVATRPFKRGEFVLEYYGELIDNKEAKRRESSYSDKENVGCYMYYFEFKNKQYCIDATKETNRLGRLINHSKKGNLRTQTFPIEDSPHLVFFARRDIELGEELTYDYGDTRKAVLENHPWLAS